MGGVSSESSPVCANNVGRGEKCTTNTDCSAAWLSVGWTSALNKHRYFNRKWLLI